jgi:predicted negative regulator of RcsB-dependent stress response
MTLLDRAVADIQDKYGSTSYAQQAALLAARIYQEKDRPADARKQLNWVIDKSGDAGYQALARLRLSTLLIDDKSFDAARQLLSANVPTSFGPLQASLERL